MLIAESQSSAGVNPALLGALILGLSLLVGLGSAIFAMFFTRREHEAHKEEVGRRIGALESNMVHLDVKIAHLDDKIALVREEIRESEDRLDEANENRSVKIHDRLNEILKAVSTLQGQINSGKN